MQTFCLTNVSFKVFTCFYLFRMHPALYLVHVSESSLFFCHIDVKPLMFLHVIFILILLCWSSCSSLSLYLNIDYIHSPCCMYYRTQEKEWKPEGRDAFSGLIFISVIHYCKYGLGSNVGETVLNCKGSAMTFQKNCPMLMHKCLAYVPVAQW